MAVAAMDDGRQPSKYEFEKMVQKSRREAKVLIGQMEHLKNTPDEIVESWLDAVCSVCKANPNRILKFAKRLSSFAASEVGTLVQGLRNLRSKYVNEIGFSHNDVESLARSKLLLEHPVAPKGQKLGGSLMEKYLIEVYVAGLKDQYSVVKVRQDLMQKLSEVSGIGTDFDVSIDPELIVECDGKIILVDIKSPSQESFKATKYSAPLEYQCYLNIGYDIARNLEEPIHFDEVKLAIYNHAERTVEEVNVEVDETLIDEIYEAIAFFKPHILRGVVPATSLSHLEIKSSNDIPDDLLSNISKMNVIKLAISALTDELSDVEAQVNAKTELMQKSLDGNQFKIDIGPSNIRGQINRILDKQAAVGFLLNNRPATEHAEVFQIKNNAAKLEKELIKHLGKEGISHFFEEKYEVKTALTLAKSGKQFDLKQNLKHSFAGSLSEFIEKATIETTASNEQMSLSVAQKQKWDLHSLAEILTTYHDASDVADKTRSMLESRIESYQQSSDFVLAGSCDKRVIEANQDLQNLIDVVRTSVLTDEIESVSPKVKQAVEQAEAELNEEKPYIELPSKSEDRTPNSGPRLITL